MRDLNAGFKLDEPDLEVLWKWKESDLAGRFMPALHKVKDGYWVAKVSALDGLRCNLGMHFGKEGGALQELEFFRDSYENQDLSYREFQSHFERAFGSPTHTYLGTAGFPTCHWILPGARIFHFVFDRFGPEEHMRVCAGEGKPPYWVQGEK